MSQSNTQPFFWFQMSHLFNTKQPNQRPFRQCSVSGSLDGRIFMWREAIKQLEEKLRLTYYRSKLLKQRQDRAKSEDEKEDRDRIKSIDIGALVAWREKDLLGNPMPDAKTRRQLVLQDMDVITNAERLVIARLPTYYVKENFAQPVESTSARMETAFLQLADDEDAKLMLVCAQGSAQRIVQKTRRVPPRGYLCHTCNEPGHFRMDCPRTHGTATGPRKIMAHGIPRSRLRPATEEELQNAEALYLPTDGSNVPMMLIDGLR